MHERIKASLAMAIVVAIPLAAILALSVDQAWYQVDYSDLPGWLASTSFTDTLAASTRLVALACAYYVVGASTLYLIAAVTRNRRLVRVMSPFTLPVIRRLADRVVAGSLAIGVLAAPVVASSAPTDVIPTASVSAEVVADYIPAERITIDTNTAETSPATTDAVADDPAASGSAVSADRPIPAGTHGGVEVVVVRGDNLWKLADIRLSAALARPASDTEIAPYWRSVVEDNRSRIRSGDPDIIYPGETITLPDPGPFTPPKN